MKVAIPLAGEKLSMHFGHCESFAFIEADTENKKVLNRETITAPPHEPGLLPAWIAEHGASLVIAGGMGQRAQQLFRNNGIEVLVGAPAWSPERLVASWLEGELVTGSNVCDH